ncbi:PAS sensor protein [Oscillochloris trichoides DG-6]|uniref:PAS sensor protein n=1 Tax=Oscillochloris trichoides DG-6 TaxID=765420 RepID=E1IHM7_9CHLR|nr:PAS domain-containing protein [Oscillochloris trichoides]EFO79326.1 PAS sensor protein [Oscillochloris trichoides DG-6]
MGHTSNELLTPPSEADTRLQTVANTSADGMLVVDGDGRVCFANPAAESLLSRESHDLIGQIFGLPIMFGEVAEINLIQPSGNLLSAEMRMSPLIWKEAPGYLIVLRDLTERRRIQEALRDAEGFSRAILNSLSQHIAVVDERGIILLVNDAWRKFAAENGDPNLFAIGVGANYFDTCAITVGGDAQNTAALLEGMQRVLRGDLSLFELEYPWDSPTEERWFQVRVVPLHDARRGMVISHTNITEQRRQARAATEAEALREQLQARERELRALGVISGGGQVRPPVPHHEASLHASRPTLFYEYIERYGHLLNAAVQERGFGVPDKDAEARELAMHLGDLRATARDVIEIHLAALRNRSLGIPPARQQAYLEEGRMLALQIMGYLVAYYRDGVVS